MAMSAGLTLPDARRCLKDAFFDEVSERFVDPGSFRRFQTVSAGVPSSRDLQPDLTFACYVTSRSVSMVVLSDWTSMQMM